MSETTFYLLGIAIASMGIMALFVGTLGQGAFLVALLFIGGGFAAVMADALFDVNALWIAAVLTSLGTALGHIAASRDIPGIAWRARGFNAATMAATFSAAALVTFVLLPSADAYVTVVAAYALLAVWNWGVAIMMAIRVMVNYDGRSK